MFFNTLQFITYLYCKLFEDLYKIFCGGVREGGGSAIRRWAQIIDVYSISQNVINELNIRPQEFYILDTPKGPDGSPPWGIQVHFHGLPKAYLFQRGKNSKKFPKVAKNARTLCNRAKRTL